MNQRFSSATVSTRSVVWDLWERLHDPKQGPYLSSQGAGKLLTRLALHGSCLHSSIPPLNKHYTAWAFVTLTHIPSPGPNISEIQGEWEMGPDRPQSFNCLEACSWGWAEILHPTSSLAEVTASLNFFSRPQVSTPTLSRQNVLSNGWIESFIYTREANKKEWSLIFISVLHEISKTV